MKKSNHRSKIGRKCIRKCRNEKYNFIHFENSEIYFDDLEETHLRTTSRQQYFRLKRKNFIQSHCENSDESVPSKLKKRKFLEEKKVEPNPRSSPSKSPSSITTDVSNSTSLFSFHLQPDWSDFEDIDPVQFTSDDVFDPTNVIQILREHQTLDYESFPDFSFPFDLVEPSLSSWATDISDDKLEQSTYSLDHIQETIRNNYLSIFQINHDVALWMDMLKEVNNIAVCCESNKYLLHNLSLKENSFALQESTFKWTNLASKCTSLKSCLEVIKDLEVVKSNFHIAIEILYEQCISLHEHEISYPNPLAIKITNGIKKISTTLRNHFHPAEMKLKELFKDCEKCNIAILDQLDYEIKNFENVSATQHENQMEIIVEILGKYLGREKTWTPRQQPVLNFCF